MSGSSRDFAKGDSAVVTPVPALDGVVGHWRDQFDRSAAQGMPAHISLLVPWLGEDAITERSLETLSDAAGSTPVEVRFREFGEFPGLLYLRPEPSRPLAEITRRIERAWPSHLHYGGVFDDVLPHLTVASGANPAQSAAITADVGRALPITTTLTEVWVVVFDGTRWTRRAELPLLG